MIDLTTKTNKMGSVSGSHPRDISITEPPRVLHVDSTANFSPDEWRVVTFLDFPLSFYLSIRYIYIDILGEWGTCHEKMLLMSLFYCFFSAIFRYQPIRCSDLIE